MSIEAATSAVEEDSVKVWQDFFSHPSFLRFSSQVLPRSRTDLELHALESWLNLGGADVKDVLDLGCGYGRIAARVSELGHSVVGVDGSASVLDRARQQTPELLGVTYLLQDMRDLDLPGETFDVVLNMSTAFGYVDDPAGDQRTIGHVARVLRPGGLFLIDTENRESKLRSERVQRYEMGGTAVDCQRSFDVHSGRWTERMTWVDGSSTDSSFFSVRLYSATELTSMISAAGLEVVETWGWFDGESYTEDSPRMIVLARKPEAMR